jgi:signal transduction histidine kinase
MKIAREFILRMIGVQLLVHFVTTLLIFAFAPRVLLLSSETVAATYAAGLVSTGLQALAIVAITLVYARRIRPALVQLRDATGAILPEDAARIYALPTRQVTTTALAALVIAGFTFTPLSALSALDTFTHTTIVFFALTLGSAALVPQFVMMRTEVRKLLELVPTDVAREAINVLDTMRLSPGRMRFRFTVAVVAPVAFVAASASLLVYAHTRAAVVDARDHEAVDLSLAAFEPVTGEDESERRAVIDSLGKLGYRVVMDDAQEKTQKIVHGDEGDTLVRVPVADTTAMVRFESPGAGPMLGVYLLLALLATGLAALLGFRFGTTFRRDVLIATREIRAVGVAQVVMGTRIFQEARFSTVEELLRAIDALGSVFRDFAIAQVRATEAREATERMRGLLLAAMSHDLKSPLNAILGFAELVMRSEINDAQQESVIIIEQRGRELLMLIQTILDSARAEAGELDIAPEQTMIGDVVMAAVLDTRDLIMGSDVQIQAEIQPGIPRLQIDGTRVVQALTSILLTSARLADRGVVSVRATMPAEADRLRIEIESTTSTLRVEERDRLFDAFKDVGSARKHGALGLGLSLARAIVEIHGGSIEVELSENAAVVFRLLMPLRASRLSRPSFGSGRQSSPGS